MEPNHEQSSQNIPTKTSFLKRIYRVVRILIIIFLAFVVSGMIALNFGSGSASNGQSNELAGWVAFAIFIGILFVYEVLLTEKQMKIFKIIVFVVTAGVSIPVVYYNLKLASFFLK